MIENLPTKIKAAVAVPSNDLAKERATNLLQVLFQLVHMKSHVLDGNIAEPRVPQVCGAKSLAKSAMGVCSSACSWLARRRCPHFSSFLM